MLMTMSQAIRQSIVLLVLLALLTGCPSQRKTSDEDLNRISRAQLMKMLEDGKQKQGLIIVDVRKPKPYADGHIPGSINIPVIELVKNDPRLADAKSIVVYGSGNPDDLLSWAAAKKLIAFGYTNVYDFRGGLQEWTGQRRDSSPLMDKRMDDKADQY